MDAVFTDTAISTSAMLASWLEDHTDEEYRVKDGLLVFGTGKKADEADELLRYLREQGAPVPLEQIYTDLPYIAQDHIQKLLRAQPDLLNNGMSSWYHRDIISLKRDDLEQIRELIREHLRKSGYITVKKLLQELPERAPSADRNMSLLEPQGVKTYLESYFSKTFSFRGKLISTLQGSLDYGDVFRNFAHENTPFTLDELKEFSEEIDTLYPSYFEKIFESAARIDKEHYIAQSELRFDIQGTDDKLEQCCPGDYIPLQTVDRFSLFPTTSVSWNIWVLEQFVFQYSHRFKLLTPSFSESFCSGAIVRKTFPANDFKELIPYVAAVANCSLTEKAVLEELNRQKYLNTKKQKITEEMLQTARVLRTQLKKA